MNNTRRNLLLGLAVTAGISPLIGSRSVLAQNGRPAPPPVGRGNPNARFDVIIKGGKVIDPANNISGQMDVAINGSKIAAVSPDIPATEGRAVYDATGKIVTPGLIDSHGHVYDGGISTSINADIVGIPHGVTTIVDAGSAGAANFVGFRKYVMETSRTRVYSVLNIGTNGCCANEIYGDMRLVDANAAINTIKANPGKILGVKVRIHGKHDEVEHDLEVLKRARQVAEACDLPIMMHWSNEPQLQALLRKGDVMTHPWNPTSDESSNVMGGPPGKVLPAINALRDRGVWFDFSNGNHLSWAIAEESAKQRWFPDLISTDIHTGHVPPRGVVIDLPTTMTKFLYLGLPLNDVIKAVTATAPQVFKFNEKIGTLSTGAEADVTVLDLRTGSFDLFDARREKRTAREKFVPVATIKGGEFVFWAP